MEEIHTTHNQTTEISLTEKTTIQISNRFIQTISNNKDIIQISEETISTPIFDKTTRDHGMEISENHPGIQTKTHLMLVGKQIKLNQIINQEIVKTTKITKNRKKKMETQSNSL